MPDYFFDHWDQPVGLWGFIIIIVLIGSVTSYMKYKSRNDLMKEALRSGQEIDPAILEDLKDPDGDGSGLMIGGAVTLAVAVGLVIMGYQIGKVEGDDEIFEVMKGVAAIPGLIGIVLLIGGFISKMSRGKKD